MDSDGDGFISAAKVDVHTLPTDILEHFAPLLCEMEELNIVLNINMFIDASERLLRV